MTFRLMLSSDAISTYISDHKWSLTHRVLSLNAHPRRFTLNLVRDMIKTYSQRKCWQQHPCNHGCIFPIHKFFKQGRDWCCGNNLKRKAIKTKITSTFLLLVLTLKNSFSSVKTTCRLGLRHGHITCVC